MAITAWRWIDTVSRHMELCGAEADETALVFATEASDPQLRDLYALALERLGCEISEIVVRSGALFAGRDPVDNGAVAAALLHSDLIVDLSGGLIERSEAAEEILEESRVVVIDLHHPDELDHLAAHPGLADRLARATEMLHVAELIRVSSLAGTSLRANLSEATTETSTGLATDTGDLAHWPAGIVWTRPAPDSLDGTIIAMPGDILHDAGHLLRSPVHLEVQQGKLVEVLGDTIDADVVRSYLEGVGHDLAYSVTALGWGMNVSRSAADLSRFDRSRLDVGRGPLTAGLVNVRIGDFGPSGGLTITLSDASVSLDQVDVVVEGRLDGPLAPDVYELAAGA